MKENNKQKTGATKMALKKVKEHTDYWLLSSVWHVGRAVFSVVIKTWSFVNNVLLKPLNIPPALVVLIRALPVAALSLATVLYVNENRDRLNELFTSKQTKEKVKQWFFGMYNQAHDVLSGVVLRNDDVENARAVVAVFLLRDDKTSFEFLKKLSYAEAIRNQSESVVYLGSGAFVRESLWSRKSRTVVSAYHVCIIGPTRKNTLKYGGFTVDAERNPNAKGLYVALKSVDGRTFKVKKMFLKASHDFCKIETEEVSEFSMPVRRSALRLELNSPANVHANIYWYGYVVVQMHRFNFAEVFVLMDRLCDVKKSVEILKALQHCSLNPNKCNPHVQAMLDSITFPELLDLIECAETGSLKEPVLIRSARLHGIIHFGYSGSPVLDEKGRVIGIVSNKSEAYIDVGHMALLYGFNGTENEWDYVLESDE